MTKLLTLDTATDACSAALMVDDVVFERYEIAPRKHTDLILPMIAALFQSAGIAARDLDAIAFGAGPGSFTGVRIATSIAQGIALAHGLPVIPLSCLAVLAAGAARSHGCHTVVPIMDARKQQIYSAVYTFADGDRIGRCVVPDWLGEPQELKLPASGDYVICGNGAAVYRDVFLGICNDPATLKAAPEFPRAADAIPAALAALNTEAAIAPEFARPVYLRAAL
jgi:tRNA threonylcarbamoyladenosine biosynthesis protein TsaB